MNASNLAIVIGPNLFRNGSTDGSNFLGSKLVECLISNCDHFFPEDVSFTSQLTASLHERSAGFENQNGPAVLQHLPAAPSGYQNHHGHGRLSPAPPPARTHQYRGSDGTDNIMTRSTPSVNIYPQHPTVPPPVPPSVPHQGNTSAGKRPKAPAPPPPPSVTGHARAHSGSPHGSTGSTPPGKSNFITGGSNLITGGSNLTAGGSKDAPFSNVYAEIPSDPPSNSSSLNDSLNEYAGETDHDYSEVPVEKDYTQRSSADANGLRRSAERLDAPATVKHQSHRKTNSLERPPKSPRVMVPPVPTAPQSRAAPPHPPPPVVTAGHPPEPTRTVQMGLISSGKSDAVEESADSVLLRVGKSGKVQSGGNPMAPKFPNEDELRLILERQQRRSLVLVESPPLAGDKSDPSGKSTDHSGKFTERHPNRPPPPTRENLVKNSILRSSGQFQRDGDAPIAIDESAPYYHELENPDSPTKENTDHLKDSSERKKPEAAPRRHLPPAEPVAGGPVTSITVNGTPTSPHHSPDFPADSKRASGPRPPVPDKPKSAEATDGWATTRL